MIILGLDPGTERSALVVYDRSIVSVLTDTNEAILGVTRETRNWPAYRGAILVIEQIESMGMAVGKETFETVFWSGRFAEAWYPGRHERITRRAVKQHLCNSMRATDANIRQALIDRFGPTTEKAIGSKKQPGPLYPIKSHLWAALAVAVTWYDLHVPALIQADQPKKGRTEDVREEKHAKSEEG